VPVGSETLVCGPYTATYGGVALGIFEGDGGLPTLEQQYAAEPVANTSAWGKVPIDDVYQGPSTRPGRWRPSGPTTPRWAAWAPSAC
jgi:hypothetical protein